MCAQRWNAAAGGTEELPPALELKLSRASRQELFGLVLCAASWRTEIRADYPDFLYASDASPWASAACKSETIGSDKVPALWANRHLKGGGEFGFDSAGRVRLKAVAKSRGEEPHERAARDLVIVLDSELNEDLHPGIVEAERVLSGDARELKRKARSVSWVHELGMFLKWNTLRTEKRT